MTEVKRNTDPYPIGGYSDPVFYVPVRMLGEVNLGSFKYAGPFGNYGDGTPFDSALGMNGWFEFTVDDPNLSRSEKRFIIRIEDYAEAVAGHLGIPYE